MARLTWRYIKERNYSIGISRGVLYIQSQPGIAWDGLISVTETSSETVNNYYADNTRWMALLGEGDYEAQVEAYTYPDEFDQILELQYGDVYDGTPQQKHVFGLCYRVERGAGYQLHLVYDAYASPTDENYESVSDAPELTRFSWDLVTLPQEVNGAHPTSHLIVDSATVDPYILEQLETVLYGSDLLEPRLPSINEILALSTEWEFLTIVPDTVSGIGDLVVIPYSGDLVNTEVDGIYRAAPTTRLRPTNVEGVYRLEI